MSEFRRAFSKRGSTAICNGFKRVRASCPSRQCVPRAPPMSRCCLTCNTWSIFRPRVVRRAGWSRRACAVVPNRRLSPQSTQRSSRFPFGRSKRSVGCPSSCALLCIRYERGMPCSYGCDVPRNACSRLRVCCQEEADELDLSLKAVCSNLDAMKAGGVPWDQVRVTSNTKRICAEVIPHFPTSPPCLPVFRHHCAGRP